MGGSVRHRSRLAKAIAGRTDRLPHRVAGKDGEVNAAIQSNAEMEELVDKPEEVRGVVRVAGPFTMEGIIAIEEGVGSPIGGEPAEVIGRVSAAFL